MKRKPTLFLLLVVIMILVSACSKKPKTVDIELVADIVYAEFGEELSEDIGDYIKAEQSVLDACILDLSDVDIYLVGTYTGLVTHGEQTITFTIIVEDTIAPKTALQAEVFYLEEGEYLDIDEILEEIEEESEFTITLTCEGYVFEEEVIYFEETGEYDVLVEITDESGNTTALEFQVIVTEITIPQFSGLTDMVVRPGETPDYLAGVTAYDDKDGDLTDKIEVDYSDVDYDENGDYEVYYTVVDSDDNEGEGVRKVKVVGNPEYDDVDYDEPDEPDEPEEPEDMTIPEIRGVRDFTIQVNGTLPDFLEGVTAFDEKDGDLTNLIDVDYSDLDIEEPGEYEVYYSVTDNDDNEGTAISTVTVVE